jgi:radical SAM superfamily enzyme YgiQ (UPF0313 family)
MNKNETILLVLMPFWTPLIPPLGIACLKGYLEKSGYKVKTVDVNVELEAREYYEGYFETLKTMIPGQSRNNYYNTGRELLRNHQMAQNNHTDEAAYNRLVKEMVHKTYYTEITDVQAQRLSGILADYNRWQEEYFRVLLEREKPAVLGISVYNGTLPGSIEAFRLTRREYPHIRTVMGGGVFADQLRPGAPGWERFLEVTRGDIDTIIVGEGELLFHRYLEGEIPGVKRVLTREDIDGRHMDLETAEIPDVSDNRMENYPYQVSYTSRSCPYQCSFCSETVQWGRYRKKPAERIAAELKEQYRRHGNQLFLMCDSLINPVITPLAETLIKEEESYYWESCIRADKEVCSPENAYLWRRGGFYKARIGIESGSPAVLELMNKKITLQQIKEAVGSLAGAGIKTLTFWIIGHPGEMESDFQQTLALIEEMRDDIYEAEGTPFYYYVTGQSNSGSWQERGRPVLLYRSERAADMLVTPPWILETDPEREVIYERLNRFIQHLDKLGIPHPYSMEEIRMADERWKRLHPNAVPSLMEFASGRSPIRENKDIRQKQRLQTVIEDDGEFGF